MEFKEFRELLEVHFLEMEGSFFVTDVSGDELWELYLNSFLPGDNEVFRERREFDCSCCRAFIRRMGNVVAVKDGEVVSIWGFDSEDAKFQPVIQALNSRVLEAQIVGPFVSKEAKIGTEVSRELIDSVNVRQWHHFYLELPERLVYRGQETLEAISGNLRATKEVFERSLSEISIEAVETVLDLVSQNSLYRGEEWQAVLIQFSAIAQEYAALSPERRSTYCWYKSVEVGPVIGRIKNHSIGTLLLDISQGVELDQAIRKYEAVVAPTNYKRPKPIFTQKMVQEAEETVERLGLAASLPRRFARLDDITINDVLFADRSAIQRMQGKSVFKALAGSIPANPKEFSRVEEVSIDQFIQNILPRCTGVSVLVENRHLPNFVSLIAPQDPQAPPLFKWDNNFSWAYSGNITDSMKENVRMAGGKVDGVLRFSIQWNDGKELNSNDFDAHCHEPNGTHIYYASKRSASGGNLDVDIIRPDQGKAAVENITWPNLRAMREGIYRFGVHTYNNRGGSDGFSAEIEFGGELFEFEYRKPTSQGEMVEIAEVFLRNGVFELTKSMKSTQSSRKVWNIDTNQFQPVLAVFLSPNFWEGRMVGNKHFIFALKDCINESCPNGFFNEFLKQDFNEHRRVFEALGREMKVEPSDDQLSGLGFSSTQRNNVVVKLEGHTSRIIRVTF
jgi:hypothetical protein